MVTELNKKPADCNYSSINQLQDDILLRVKKDGVIKKILVCGCLAQRYKDEVIKEMPEIDGKGL